MSGRIFVVNAYGGLVMFLRNVLGVYLIVRCLAFNFTTARK